MSQNDKLTTGMDAQDYYENERRMAAHAPYADVSQAPPGYGIQMQQHAGAIQPSTVVVMEPPFAWNWCTLVTTVIAFFLCPLCGFTGTVMSLLSYTDHQAKNYNNARSKKSVALCCGITGIVVFVVWVALLIALVANGVIMAERSINRNNNFN